MTRRLRFAALAAVGALAFSAFANNDAKESDVVNAMLDADYLSRVREKPYKEAKADMTFYALNRDRKEVKNALNGG